MFQSNTSEIKNLYNIRYLKYQQMDISMALNEIKHELSLLEGYSLPLDILFILSAGINFTRLLNGAVKINTFCRRKVLAKQEEKRQIHKGFFNLFLY